MAKCSECDGQCCKYITITVDEPKKDIDFEELKWFLCHENILVYIDHEDDWCVEVKTPCKFQDPVTNHCTIYEKRPRVCIEHGLDECEGNKDYEDYCQRAFKTLEDIDEYRKELQSGKKAQKVQSKSDGEPEGAEQS